MRASFREYSWARALVSLCLMVVGAMVLPACPPAAPSDVCIAGNASGTVCASGEVCNAMAIATGHDHTCTIVGPQLRCRAGDTLTPPVDGACTAGASPITVGTGIRCWGKNENGQLGNGPHSSDNPQTNRNSPTRVSNPSSPTSGTTQVREYLRIAANGNHTCALLVGGAVECWGNNGSGQLGNGTTTDSATPVAVTGLTNVVEIAVGGAHTCAIVEVPGADMGAASRREVRCWGLNSFGQLGNGSSGVYLVSSIPVAVRASATGADNLTNVVELAAGGNHTCARLQNGEVRCWGSNAYSQLGFPGTSRDAQSEPLTVAGLSNVVDLAAGLHHTCARLNTGEILCWGKNEDGQLGDRTFTSPRAPPTSGTLCCPDGHEGPGPYDPARRREACASGCVNLQTDNANCGACGNVCADGTQCTAGHCLPATACSTCVYSACSTAATACARDVTCREWLTCHAACVDDTCRDQCMKASTALATAVTRCQATQCESACRGHRLAAGESHTCAINSADKVVCWGDNTEDQLGVSGSGDRCEAVPDPTDVVEVAAGGEFSCARTSDKTVSCWGTPTMTGPSVGALSEVVQVAAGASHACALLSGGKVRCWGSNAFGQLVDGGTTTSATPVEVTGLTGVVEIAAGGNHTCARRSDGTVRCWGDASERGGSSPAMDVQGLSGVVGIAAGSTHSCARLQNGDVRCWGSNSAGQLGNGTTTNSSTPVAVTGLTNVVEIAAGASYTCARLQGGAVQCWGSNSLGQLGTGTTDKRQTPVAVPMLTNVVEIAAGGSHTCARLQNGDVRCWGNNGSGRLGIARTIPNSTTPVLSVCVRGCAENGDIIPMSTPMRRMDTACGLACVDTRTNAAHCGACGNACPDGQRCVASACVAPLRCDDPLTRCGPPESEGCFDLSTAPCHCGSCGMACAAGQVCVDRRCADARASRLAAGAFHTCQITTNGAVRCWGDSSHGQRGGATNSCAVCSGPASIPGASADPAVDLSAGQQHTCAVLRSGAVQCWGANASGEIGNGTRGVPVLSPANVMGITNAVEVAAGYGFTCARLEGGRVLCWGVDDVGQLGTALSTTGMPGRPFEVTGLVGADEIVAGDEHACARVGGAVRCWGGNQHGQLGTAGPSPSSTPLPVAGLDDAIQVGAAGSHTCALRRGGAVVCWGRNQYGQLGDGIVGPSRPNPMPVQSANGGALAGVIEIAVGRTFGCARRNDNTVECWGTGVVGEGSPRSRPVRREGSADAPLGGVVELAAGAAHVCARLMDGSVRCWGHNESGELGVGQGANSANPVTATCTGATTCTATQMACGTGCCPMGWTCLNGRDCMAPMSSCMPDQTSCPGVGCVNLQDDRSHCGSCGNACSSNVNCVRGMCAPISTGCMSEADCTMGQSCCGGMCAALDTTTNCGVCGMSCIAGQSCSAGRCTATTCMAPSTTCGTTCVNTNTSTANCGMCGRACTAPTNGTATCTMGMCGFTCPMPFTNCADACVNMQTDVNNCGMCGTRCTAGQSCSMGTCTLPCVSGTMPCGGTCANTQTDVNNCGACGTRCTPGQSCCNGMCAATNTTTNCGACGVTCAAPPRGTAACTSGACAIGSCNTGFANCDGVVANGCETPLGTTSNCGRCGNACTAPTSGTATCTMGMCDFTCVGGSTRCGAACVNLQADDANCGACARSCAPGQVCSSGACAVSCMAGLTNCSGACVDLTRDNANCGRCGTVCPPLTGGRVVCASSMCSSSCPTGTHAVGTACVGDGGPKPVSPISLGDVTQLRPAFRWINPTNANGAVIDVCNDRACASIEQTIEAPASGGVATTTAVATTPLMGARTYYWRVRAMVGAVADTTTTNNSPVWLFHTPRANRGPVQTSVRPHLDVNGDGIDDLAVGVPNASSGAGRVDLFLGRASVLPMTVHLSLAGSADARFGTSVSSAGDVNGDGFGDLVVGAPGASSGSGAVALYLGGAMGLSATASFTAPGAAGGALGTTVTGAGDVDLDGYADLVAGAPAAGSNAGSAVWYRGAANVTSLASATLSGTGGANVQFGLTLAGVGDLNGDGYSDVLVGEPGYNSNQGRLHVFRGGLTGLPMSATTRHDGGSVGDRFTAGLAGAGDVNADGYSDAVASAPLALGGNRGGFNVFVGGAGGFTTASVPAGDTSNAGWGRILAGAGDVNGNGRDDVLVAAPFVDSNRGRVYLVDGEALLEAGTFGFPTRLFEQSGAAQYAAFGASLAGLGDIDGDGYADAAFGAPGENSDALGSVYVLRGARSVPATASAFMISMAGGDRYGAALGGLDAMVPDAPASCTMGLARCGAACVDTSSNASNCGGCGRACAMGQMCASGVCATVARCPTGQTDCTPTAMTATCRSLQTDVNNCGMCSRVCPAPTEGSATCAAGTCGQSCPSGQMVCGSACVTLGEACSAGLGACLRTGMVACTGGSPMCNAVPGTPAPTETCNNVDDDCDGAVDDGATCPTGQSCVSGMCMSAGCPGARPMTCGSSVDLNESRTNCGACGNDCGSCGAACAQARACLAGVCTSFGTGAAVSDMPTMSAGVEMGAGAEPFDDRCPQGFALTRTVGFVGPSGITGLQVTCSRILLNYTTCGGATISVGTTTRNLNIHGGAGPFGIPGVCPPGEVMAGFSGSASGQINAFTMRCGGLSATLTPPPLDVTVGSLSDDFTQGDASSGVPFGPIDCPPGTIAVGITGWETPSAVQGIALRCARPVANTMIPP